MRKKKVSGIKKKDRTNCLNRVKNERKREREMWREKEKERRVD